MNQSEASAEVFNVYTTADNGQRIFSHVVILIGTQAGQVSARYPGSSIVHTTPVAEWDKLDLEPAFRTPRLAPTLSGRRGPR